MMTKYSYDDIVQAIIERIDIPDSAYEKAEGRYRDLGEWFCRDESSCREHVPAVFSQGSFLLGTVVRPLGDEEEYDLDLACKLQKGATKSSHTQKNVKETVGAELEAYRQARGIKDDMEEKRRCWRLLYQDDLRFHMDIVPCITEERERRALIKESMMERGSGETLADAVAEQTVAITDTKHEAYRTLSYDWNVSNPQGYARWFESRVRLAKQAIEERLKREMATSVEELPTYKLKAPLQRCVQLLKRHRDVMFRDDPDRQPISVIITTLAGKAYHGEEDLHEALEGILSTMGGHVNDRVPRVPNPVNPEEDFADKWHTDEGRRLDLEGNFWLWLRQARADFQHLTQVRDADSLAQKAQKAFEVPLSREAIEEALGLSAAPAIHTKKHRIEKQPKPWCAV